MLEHLPRDAARAFLSESKRVLAQGGTLRLVVPDLRKAVELYVNRGDADAFTEWTLMYKRGRDGLLERFTRGMAGAREHAWLYDGPSLVALVEEAGFRAAAVVAPGTTRIPDPGSLDLREREDESVFVEATKP